MSKETIYWTRTTIEEEEVIYATWSHSSGRMRHFAFIDDNGDGNPIVMEKSERAYEDGIECFVADKMDFDNIGGSRPKVNSEEWRRFRKDKREEMSKDFEYKFVENLKESDIHKDALKRHQEWKKKA